MANGFGEAFGSAYARSLQMTREEYEKEREKKYIADLSYFGVL